MENSKKLKLDISGIKQEPISSEISDICKDNNSFTSENISSLIGKMENKTKQKTFKADGKILQDKVVCSSNSIIAESQQKIESKSVILESDKFQIAKAEKVKMCHLELRVVLTRIDQSPNVYCPELKTNSQNTESCQRRFVQVSPRTSTDNDDIGLIMECESIKVEDADVKSHLDIRNLRDDVCVNNKHMSVSVEKHCTVKNEEMFVQLDQTQFCDIKACASNIDFKYKSFGEGSTQQNYFKAHTTQAEDNPFDCHACGKNFEIKDSLTQHIRIHSEDKRFECETGGKGFNEMDDHKWHTTISNIHTEDEPFKCETCGKSYQTDSLQTHMEIHTGAKSFKCETCGKTFIRSGQLQLHIRIHTQDKPFKCDTCGNSFKNSSSFQSHMRIHTGDKPFECETCGKRFIRSNHLKGHILRIHTGDKPFKCETCGKRFACSSHLQIHVRIHTGDKSFECETCGKRFNTGSKFQNHMRIHREMSEIYGKVYICRYVVA